MATYYVDYQNGDNSNDGSESAPLKDFGTLDWDGSNSLVAGDTVRVVDTVPVEDGSWDLFNTGNSSGSKIEVRPDDPSNRPEIDCTGEADFVKGNGAQNIEFWGLDVYNIPEKPFNFADSLGQKGDDIVVRDMHIHNWDTNDTGSSAITFTHEQSRSYAERNGMVAYNNYIYEVASDNGGADCIAVTADAQNCKIHQNLCVHGADDGIDFLDADPNYPSSCRFNVVLYAGKVVGDPNTDNNNGDGSGIKLGGGSGTGGHQCDHNIVYGCKNDGINTNDADNQVTIQHNTSVFNDGDGYRFTSQGGSPHLAENNVAWQNPRSTQASDAAEENNNTWNLGISDPDFVVGDIPAHPGFVRPERGSDLVGAGTDAGFDYITDIGPYIGARRARPMTWPNVGTVNVYTGDEPSLECRTALPLATDYRY